jgi:hypothetical protein
MIHPATELKFINDIIGYGVVATKFIPKGTITWALDKLDRIYTPQQVAEMDKLYQEVLDKYTYRNSEGDHILCWDNARFVNHSSNSNCITTAYEFEIAIRDIYPGEELTDDYGYLNLDEPFEVVPEEGTTRNVIYPDDLLRYHTIWDEKLLHAFPQLIHVEQPLLSILDVHTQEKAKLISSGQEKMNSILSCYFGLSRLNGRKADLELIHGERVVYP